MFITFLCVTNITLSSHYHHTIITLSSHYHHTCFVVLIVSVHQHAHNTHITPPGAHPYISQSDIIRRTINLLSIVYHRPTHDAPIATQQPQRILPRHPCPPSRAYQHTQRTPPIIEPRQHRRERSFAFHRWNDAVAE